MESSTTADIQIFLKGKITLKNSTTVLETKQPGHIRTYHGLRAPYSQITADFEEMSDLFISTITQSHVGSIADKLDKINEDLIS